MNVAWVDVTMAARAVGFRCTVTLSREVWERHVAGNEDVLEDLLTHAAGALAETFEAAKRAQRAAPRKLRWGYGGEYLSVRVHPTRGVRVLFPDEEKAVPDEGEDPVSE